MKSKGSTPPTIAVSLNDLRAIRDRIERRSPMESDWRILGVLLGNYLYREESRTARLQAKANAIETTQESDPTPFPSSTDEPAVIMDAEFTEASAANITSPDGAKRKAPAKGHGRCGHKAFQTATDHCHQFPDEFVPVCHRCQSRRVKFHRPRVQIRIIGQPMFSAERHEISRCLCRNCGLVIEALAPSSPVLQGVGKSVVYAPSACAMLLMMHYVASLPFKRIEALHRGWEIPLSDATLYEIADQCTDSLEVVVKALSSYAMRNGQHFLIDDTGTMVISLKKQIEEELEAATALGLPEDTVRTGINATGIIIQTAEGRVVMYQTGRHHAGEIIDQLMKQRPSDLEKIVKVTDGASKNFDHRHRSRVIEGVCNAHAFLKFDAIKKNHPVEYAIVGEAYHHVFQNDALARQHGMSAADRLRYHQAHSTKWMNQILTMCKNLIEQKLERNSKLWEPVSFIINKWDELTRFLKEPGVPLDTNIGEQSLIVITRYLSASFFYKTQNGADTGDIAMSLAATARANDVEPVAYMTFLLENAADLAAHPEKYFPWACRDEIKRRGKPPDAAAA